MIQMMGAEFIKRWKVALSGHLGRSANQLIGKRSINHTLSLRGEI